jgi:hypothetical protein
MRDARAHGATLRDIAAAVGMSHAGVANQLTAANPEGVEA